MADLISKIKGTDNTTYDLQDKVSTFGGTNLVWNSNFLSGSTAKWNNWGSPTTRNIVSVNNKYWEHIVTTTAQFQGYSQNSGNRSGYGEIKAGDIIIGSFMAYGKNGGEVACLGIHWLNSSGSIVSQSWWTATLTTTPTRYVFSTATVPTNGVGFNIMIGDNTSTAQEMWITEIKLEKSNKSTQWTPAPADLVTYTSSSETIEFFQ